MFTGIIEEIGTVKNIKQGGKSIVLTLSAGKVLTDMKTGDSINTNGVCLTVVTFDAGSFSADVMPETMRRTNLGILRPGSKVNLERALKLSDRLGGHLINGHIDGTGAIRRKWDEDNATWFRIESDAKILRYVVEKGSVAIDGISLTVAAIDNRSFDVSIIPHTREVTTMMTRNTGDILNIECDITGKYIEKLLSKEKSEIDLNFLTKNGFI